MTIPFLDDLDDLYDLIRSVPPFSSICCEVSLGYTLDTVNYINIIILSTEYWKSQRKGGRGGDFRLPPPSPTFFVFYLQTPKFYEFFTN